MTQPNDLDAALVLSRFGLGARADSLASIGQDPRNALKQEIAARFVPVPTGPELKPSPDLVAELLAFQQQRMAKPAATTPAPTPAPNNMAPAKMPPATPSMAAPPTAAPSMAMRQPTAMQAEARTPPRQPAEPYVPQAILLAEVDARFNGTIHEPVIGFGERLAMFWANHFAVAIAKDEYVHILAGAFEREAIRPHVFGRFEAMLQAVETHPAMLVYLDNQQSIGPNSKAGLRTKRGLNENLAREIMELHTLGVDGGYTQADVTTMARVLTGWTMVGKAAARGQPGTFTFNPGTHEPADQTLLGVAYRDDGLAQGQAVLRDLARHPATAHHLATKLARHFVADVPPASLVAKLAAAYTKSDGDLSAVYLALIEAEEAWAPGLAKFRSPLEFTVALLRAGDERPPPNRILAALRAMGQPLWNPSGPNGFADTVDAWASSEGLSTRIEVANLLAATMAGRQVDPRRFAAERLGALLNPATADAISHAATKAQGLSIAFLSPEFQRR
ncbi:MAG: DUF1800 family protein [Ancalomicrobiaceae bacterium]|nr:DUF1800 family protein [Ancalomicrobiaceae bacterium]